MSEIIHSLLAWIWNNWNAVTVFTGALVVVGALQFYIYWRQARYMQEGLGITREGLRVTRDAADAAAKSAEIADRSLTLLERPWISVELQQSFRPTITRQDYRFKIINTGRSPAKIKRTGFVVQWHHAMPQYPVDQKDMSPMVTETFIHPGQALTPSFEIPALSQTDADDIIEGRQILAIFGSILYDDVFDARHITRFCRIYTRIDPSGLGGFILPQEPRPEYNESD